MTLKIKSVKKENLTKIEMCFRLNRCSANICPLDPEAGERIYILAENRCPFTINRKRRGEKGIRTQMPDYLLKVVPKSNLKTLNLRNQKRWQKLQKKTKYSSKRRVGLKSQKNEQRLQRI